MIVKICGMTNVEDARLAAQLGVDWIGLNFYKGSRRCVDAQTAAAIRRSCGAKAAGVFVNEVPERIRHIVLECGLDAAQLHGDEDEEFEAHLEGIALIKAFRVNSDFDFQRLESTRADWVLLDNCIGGAYGGTGRSFDWNLAKPFGSRIWLSGGLTAENVEAAIGTVRPAGIDVCSGVERRPGQKDPVKMKALIEKIEELKRRFEHESKLA